MISPAAPLLDDAMAPLRPWLDDPASEDLAVNLPDEAWIYQRGGWTKHSVPLDYDAIEEIVTLSGSLRQQEVGAHAPLLDTYLHTRERLSVCFPPTVEAGTISLTIRRPSSRLPLFSEINERYQTDSWHEWEKSTVGRDEIELLELFDRGDIEGFLRAAVRNRLGMIMAGETGAGKTTFSNMLASEIDHSERVITIEDAIEFVVPQPNCVRLLYSQDGQGGTHTGLGNLIKAGLRMRPNRLIIQEIRETEAAWLFVHHTPAHRGSITTIHGDDAPSAARRLFGYCKGSEVGGRFDDRSLIQTLADAVDVIVPMKRNGEKVAIGKVWYAGDRRRHGESLADLLS